MHGRRYTEQMQKAEYKKETLYKVFYSENEERTVNDLNVNVS